MCQAVGGVEITADSFARHDSGYHGDSQCWGGRRVSRPIFS